jgi:hypothetical protein
MILSLRGALARRGISLHPSKCKVQTNRHDFTQRGFVCLDDGFSIQILQQGDCLELLGTALSLDDFTGIEIDNRIAVGWRKFWSLKRLLLNRSFSLKKRLLLFDSTVTECVLWGAESWTPRVGELNRLKATQNTMLRRIVGIGRCDGEDWIEWMKRATCRVRAMASDAKLKEWVPEHFRRKWRWAAKIVHADENEWVGRVTWWRDSSWQAEAADLGTMRPRRPSKRRWMKFEDPLRQFCRNSGLGEWRLQASLKNTWADLTHNFVRWAAKSHYES